MTAAQPIIEPVYKDHIKAIVAALICDITGEDYKASSWQNQVVSGYRISSIGPDLTKKERFEQNCLTHRLLHNNLSEIQWSILYVRFYPAVERDERIVGDRAEIERVNKQLEFLLNYIDKPISDEFALWCVLRWASRLSAKRQEWKNWEGRTDYCMRTIRQRCYDLYKTLNALESQAKERARDLLVGASLIIG